MKTNVFPEFLDSIDSKPLKVLDDTIPESKYVPIDLSESNEALNRIDVSSSSKLAMFVNEQIKRKDGIVAYGGYLEVRTIYKRSRYFNSQAHDERNIHLGMDMWCKAGTFVLTPLDGVVHKVKNNVGYGDYGPTIILKHVISNVKFYTLYGHLSLSSINKLQPGTFFSQGDCIAKLGDVGVNGDYPPHLHFQIIKDIGDSQGDYQGVSSLSTLDFFKQNCPDPDLLLKLSHSPK